MFHGICEVANTIIHLQINEGLSSLALHFTFFTRHRKRSKTFPCIFMFFQEVKSKHDLVFVSFVSAYRMNISQRSRCLKRIWRMRWACTMRWRPRPRTTRRSRMCSNWRPPTGGSCFFKPSMFCGFGFFLFIRLQSITMFQERESGSVEEMFWVGVKIIGYIRETASCLGKLEWEIETLGPSSCFCKGALWLLLSHLPSLELCILVNKIQGLYTQWVKSTGVQIPISQLFVPACNLTSWNPSLSRVEVIMWISWGSYKNRIRSSTESTSHSAWHIEAIQL